MTYKIPGVGAMAKIWDMQTRFSQVSRRTCSAFVEGRAHPLWYVQWFKLFLADDGHELECKDPRSKRCRGYSGMGCILESISREFEY